MPPAGAVASVWIGSGAASAARGAAVRLKPVTAMARAAAFTMVFRAPVSTIGGSISLDEGKG